MWHRHWRAVAGELSCKLNRVGPTGGFCALARGVTRQGMECLPEGLAGVLGATFATSSVLDLGCGKGQYGRWFAKFAPSVRWTGVDGAEGIEKATGRAAHGALPTPCKVVPCTFHSVHCW